MSPTPTPITDLDRDIVQGETAETAEADRIADIEAEVRLDLMTDVMAAGGPTYRRPSGHPSRPRSGPFEGDEESR
ncbi:MAG TPA: hypothetical protein VLA89_11140 [Gemmatimonadales bacterium]|nr:hypothetical protein [Gemmatimonadales bacterium]